MHLKSFIYFFQSEIVRKTFPKIDLEYHQRKIHEVYDIMERYLGRNKYLALNKVSIEKPNVFK